MPSVRESFFESSSRFAVIGNSSKHPFPKLTFQGLKQQGKTVYAVDPAGAAVEGNASYRDLSSLPGPVDAAILELPRDETAKWVRVALAAGVRKIWLHEDTETPEALEAATNAGAECFTGTCAVMYLMPKAFPHSLHRWIMQRLRKY